LLFYNAFQAYISFYPLGYGMTGVDYYDVSEIGLEVNVAVYNKVRRTNHIISDNTTWWQRRLAYDGNNTARKV
jgi:hypothetical protein